MGMQMHRAVRSIVASLIVANALLAALAGTPTAVSATFGCVGDSVTYFAWQSFCIKISKTRRVQAKC